MDFFDSFFGMPWDQFMQSWKMAVGILFSRHLFLTIFVYILYVVALAISDVLDMLAAYTFYFFIFLLLFSGPVVRAFDWIEWFLLQSGIQLPKIFA